MPTLARPSLIRAVHNEKTVRKPLTDIATSTAVLADAVTQTVCEASAQVYPFLLPCSASF